MTKKIDTLPAIKQPVFFISLVLSRALGLEMIVPNLHIITIQKDPLIPILRKQGISCFCLHESTPKDTPKNSFELLSHIKVKAFIKQESQDLKPNILIFKSLPQIQHLCKQEKYNYLQSDPFIVRDLEDKVLFQKLLLKNNIEIIPSQIKTFESCKWENTKMVLQLRRGFAGNSSFVIHNKKEFLTFQKKYSKHQVKLSPFIEGLTLTVNGCITNNNIRTGTFFVQLEKHPNLSQNELATVGNSHFQEKNITPKIHKEINQLITKISQTIQDEGFRGFFGLDLKLSNNGKIYPIECNPRLTASIGNYTKMQIYNKQTPLLWFHFAHFLNFNTDIETFASTYLDYTFLTFRNTSTKDITLKHNLKPGIYAFNQELIFKRESLEFPDCNNEEYLLLPKNNHSTISPNQEYLYLLTKNQLFINNKATTKGERIIQKIKNQIL